MVLDTLHLQRLVSLQISLSPSVPILAFAGTATGDTRCEIISILGLSNPVVMNVIQTGKIFFYASHSKLNAVRQGSKLRLNFQNWSPAGESCFVG